MPHAPFFKLFLLATICAASCSALAQDVSVSATGDATPAAPAITTTDTVPLDPGLYNLNAPSIPSAGEAVPPALSLGFSSTPRRPFHLNLSLTGGYNDNVDTTANGQGSAFVGSQLSGSYSLATPRTRAQLQVNGGLTYYLDRQGSNSPDYNASLGLTLAHRFTPRLSVDSSLLLTYQPEPNFALNTGINRRQGDFFYANFRLSGTYLWTPRFSTVTSYTFNDLQMIGGDNGTPNLPGAFGAATEDRIENTIGTEFRYLILPTTTAVAEYRLQFTTYQSGGNSDSITHYGLLGVNQTIGPRLSLSLRGGAQYRISGQDDSFSPYFEGTLTYVLSRSSLVTWVNQYGIQEGATMGEGQRTNFHTGINLSYRWTARISSALGFYYDHNSRDGTTNSTTSGQGSDENIDLNLSTSYRVNRFASVQLSYNFTDVMSDQALASYTRNRVSLGLNIGF